MKHDLLIRDVVTVTDAGGTGVVIVKLPSGDGSVVADAARDIDHAGRSEVSPGELLFARPHELHRFAGFAREAGSFDSRIASVLAAVTSAGVGNDYANAIFWDAKCLGKLTPHAEGPLRAGPDRELAARPLSNSRTRLERCVSDVSYSVSLL